MNFRCIIAIFEMKIRILSRNYHFDNYDEFHFRWLNIKGFDATFPILLTQYFNHLIWSSYFFNFGFLKNLKTCIKLNSGALIFALIMISLVIMCIISLCVAKAQQGKGAQKYGPHTDVPGKHSRNFVRNVQPYER